MDDILRLGTSCNQNCVFCFTKEMVAYDLSTEEAKQSIQQLSQLQKECIFFSGGEPTIRKDLSELIAHANSCGFKIIGVRTNGTNLEQKYLESLKNAGLNYCNISLHSHIPAISDELTGNRGGYTKTIAGINNALNLNLFVSITHVINSKNYHDIENFVKFINIISTKIKIEFSFIVPFADKKQVNDIVPNLSDVKPFLIKSLDYCSEKNISFILNVFSVPLCFCGEHIDKNVELKYMVDLEKNKIKECNYSTIKGMSDPRGIKLWSKYKTKVEKCAGCTLYEHCNGVWTNYLKIYGDSGIEPILTNKLVLFDRLLFFLNKKPTINLAINSLSSISLENNSRISFELDETELNKEVGNKIIIFLTGLNKEGKRVVIEKPIPKCVLGRCFFEITDKYNIPFSCESCPALFTVDKNNRVEYCKIIKNNSGPSLNAMRNQNQIYDYFKTFYNQLEPFDVCKSCLYLQRGLCNWCNRKRK